jgi:micrococcal nuclease
MIQATVTYVYDGDTIKVKVLESGTSKSNSNVGVGDEFDVRFLLIDTPESVGEKAGMPFGKEASEFTKSKLTNQVVYLEYDKGTKVDPYGRHLCYVYLQDHTRIQDLLIKEGLGMIRYINPPNTKYLNEFRKLEQSSRDKKKGIWSLNGYVIPEKKYNNTYSSIPEKLLNELLKGKIDPEKTLQLLEDAKGILLESQNP